MDMKKNKITKIPLIILSVFLLCFAYMISGISHAAEMTEVVEKKMQMERILENHVSTILDKLIGTGKSTVVINIVPDVEKSKTEVETWAEKKSSGDEKAATGTAAATSDGTKKATAPPKIKEFLPGIPLKKDLTEGESRTTAAESPAETRATQGVRRIVESEIKMPQSFIKRMSVTIVIDDKVDDVLIRTSEEVISEVLAIDKKRGDTLVIKKARFKPLSPWYGFLFSWKSFVIFLVIFLTALVALFLFGPLKNFLKDFLDTARSFNSANNAQNSSGIAGMGLADIQDREDEKDKEDKAAGDDIPSLTDNILDGNIEEEEETIMAFEPFKFIQKQDLRKVLFLIKDEQPRTIASILDYLDPSFASAILSGLPEELRLKVVYEISRMRQISDEELKKITAVIKHRIEYVSGGLDKFASLLDLMEPDNREMILKSIAETDPEFAKKVRELIFTFDQIAGLDDGTIRLIIEEINTSNLAIAIRRADEKLNNKIMDNMSEGGRALLKEEMEFGKPVSEARIKDEQVKIIGTIKKLEEEGKITITRKKKNIGFETEEIDPSEGKIDLLSDADNIEEEVSAAKNEKAFEHYNAGIEAVQRGDYKTAIKEFITSVKFNNRIWQTYQYLGTCYMSLGREIDAMKAYERALHINPDNEELRQWLNERRGARV